MAGAIVPIVATAIQVIGPAIPSIVSWVEGLFGHSSTNGKKTGADKLTTVVGIITETLTNLANAGILPSAGIVDPNFKSELTKTVQAIVDAMNKNGLLNGAATVPTVSVVPGAAALTPGSSAPVVTPVAAVAGNTFTLTLVPGQAFTISLAKA